MGVGLNIAPLAVPPGREFTNGFACLQELDPAASPVRLGMPDHLMLLASLGFHDAPSRTRLRTDCQPERAATT